MAASFDGAYFSRDTTDNTSLYLTLYGGTDIPAESTYDDAESELYTQFKFIYPTSVTAPSYEGIENYWKAGLWSWDSNRTELTVPMYWGDITEPGNQGLDGGTGADWFELTWYTTNDYNSSSSTADDWKQISAIHTAHFISTGFEGISLTFKDSSDTIVDEYTSWDNTSGTPNTFEDGLQQIFDSPIGTSGRKNVYGTDGFIYDDISAYSSSGGGTGDPHITTFGGNKYTL